MEVREERIARIHVGLTFKQFALFAIVAVLIVLLFPARQGSLSVVDGAPQYFGRCTPLVSACNHLQSIAHNQRTSEPAAAGCDPLDLSKMASAREVIASSKFDQYKRFSQ